MLIDVSSRCVCLIISPRHNITVVISTKTLGYTAKLSNISMILNFVKKNDYLLFYWPLDKIDSDNHNSG
jgi:hypothetical protein